MGTGAYTEILYSGSSTVALPPAGNSGAAKFTNVYVSFASSAAVAVTVTVLTKGGPLSLPLLTVGPGRTGCPHAFDANDLAINVKYTPVAGEIISALIEYTTP